MSTTKDRRTFLATALGLGGLSSMGLAAQGRGAAVDPLPKTTDFNMGWLDEMKGRHKQLYDLGGISLAEEPRPLR